MTLTAEQRKEFDDYYLPAEPIKCPKCGSTDNAAIIIGRPSASLCEYAENNDRVRLGGCCPTQDENGKLVNMQCNSCPHGFHRE